MSIETVVPEPKKRYLDLLIMLDFNLSDALYRRRAYADAIGIMEAIINQARLWHVAELKEIIGKLDEYSNGNSSGGAMEELRPMARTLQDYLNEHWFSELHLGVIPTAVLQPSEETKIPSHEAVNPTQTSRL